MNYEIIPSKLPKKFNVKVDYQDMIFEFRTLSHTDVQKCIKLFGHQQNQVDLAPSD